VGGGGAWGMSDVTPGAEANVLTQVGASPSSPLKKPLTLPSPTAGRGETTAFFNGLLGPPRTRKTRSVFAPAALHFLGSLVHTLPLRF
jgi:hypothetical protein